MSRRNKIMDKDRENQNLINAIEKARLEINTAEKFFQYVSDPELVDVAIYELEARKSRYRYLIKVAKEKGIKNDSPQLLVGAVAK